LATQAAGYAGPAIIDVGIGVPFRED